MHGPINRLTVLQWCLGFCLALAFPTVRTASVPFLYAPVGAVDTEGTAQGVDLVGDLAYVADGAGGLAIINVADPAQPSLVFQLPLKGPAMAVTVSGRYAYLPCGAAGLEIVDVLDPSQPIRVAGIDSAGESMGVAVAGHYAYLADGYVGVRVIDLSDLASPVVVGTAFAGRYFSSVQIVGSQLIAGDGDGMQFINIDNPAAPMIGPRIQLQGGALGFVVRGNIAFLASGNRGFVTIDISNPEAPQVLATAATGNLAVSVELSGHLAFVSTAYVGVHVFDVADPAKPVLIGLIPSLAQFPEMRVRGHLGFRANGDDGLQTLVVPDFPWPPTELALNQPYQLPTSTGGGIPLSFRVVAGAARISGPELVVTNDGPPIVIEAVQSGDPSIPAIRLRHEFNPWTFNPSLLGNYKGTPGLSELAWDVKVLDKLAYVSNKTRRLDGINLADPTAPFLQTVYSSNGGAGMDLSGSLLLTCGLPNGLSVFRIQSDGTPNLLTRLSLDANEARIAGSIACVAARSSGFILVGLTDPAKPQILGRYQTQGFASGVAVSGHFAFVAEGDVGLEVIDIQDPAHPVAVGSLHTAGYAMAVAVDGEFAYVSGGTGGFHVIEVADPAQPVLRSTYGAGFAATQSAKVEGGIAYVAADGGMSVLDVSNPLHPELLGKFAGPVHARAVDVYEGRAYVADTQTGLYIVKLRDVAGQTLSFELPPTIPFTPDAVTLSATSSLGLPVTYEVLSGPAVVEGNILHVTGTGTVEIRVSQPGGRDTLPVSLRRSFQAVHENLTAWGNRTMKTTAQLASIPLRLAGIVTGTHHGLALDDTGQVSAWGRNYHDATLVPAGLSQVVAVAGGSAHSLALTRSGAVAAWGENWHGQTNVPPAATNVVALSAGWAHSVALRADGTVVAWGDDDYGQLEVPANAVDLIAIDCGYTHTLGLRADGRVVSWGLTLTALTKDEQDRLAHRYEDAVPDNATNMMAVAAGWAHSLALRQDGTVLAWGDNKYGQIDVPPAATNVIAIAAGYYHSAALRADGKVIAWGRDVFGVVNDAGGVAPADAIAAGEEFILAAFAKGPPAIAPTPQQLTSTVAGAAVLHANALAARTATYQWLHDGVAVAGATRPTLVIAPVVPGDAGLYVMRVTDPGGTTDSLPTQLVVNAPPVTMAAVATWGDNEAGECEVPPTLVAPRAIAAGAFHALALQADGRIVGWGRARDGQTTPPPGIVDPVAIAAGGDHSLALTRDGHVFAWGRNWDGQATVPPAAQTGCIQVAAGWAHSLALRADGTVVGWGNDEYEQAHVPFFLNHVVAVSAGYYHSLALRGDGSVVAWGEIDDVPSGLPPFVAIAAGWRHSLGLTRDGGVVAWGENGYGELDVPPGATNVVALSAGYGFSIALRADGSVIEWGRNSFGQLKAPAGLPSIGAVSAGEDYVLALAERGPVRITSPPRSFTADDGGGVLLRVETSGSRPVSYQWSHGASVIAGATDPFLPLGPVSASDQGDYFVSIQNSLGEIFTSAATLTVMSVPIPVPALRMISEHLETAGTVTVEVRGGAAVELIVETSTNLDEWSEVQRVTGQGTDQPIILDLSSGADDDVRFWRVR